MNYKLTNNDINIACEEVGEFLSGHNCETKELLRIKLGMEDMLMSYQKLMGSEAEFTVNTGSGLGRNKIRLVVPGQEFDPYASLNSFSDEDEFIRNALNQMGKLPRWRYKRGANEVLFTTDKKKMPEWLKLVVAISAAVICGLGIRLMPEAAATIIRDGIIAPLITTFLGFLNAVAGPMIFLAVVWGIYSIGDAATFSEVGKSLSKKAGLFVVLSTIIVALVTLPFFSLNYGDAQTGGDFSSLYQMVLDIIPSNLFTPFARGNTLQILFVAVVVGVTMLLVGKNTQAVADLSEQLGFIVNGIMSVISTLVPAFVFGSIFTIVASSEFSKLATGGKYLIMAAVGNLIMVVLHMIITCIKSGLTPIDLWKRTLSTFVIAVTTASSSAAFSDNINTCINKLGVSERLTSFGVPFGQILYKPGVAIIFWYAAICTAEAEQIPTSVTWIVTALFMSIVLATAAPPVPGGMSASFTILFAQLGLPEVSIAVILSLTTILDFMVTGTDIFAGQCLLKLTSIDMKKKRR